VFDATDPFLFCDYFRVPYRVAEPGELPDSNELQRRCARLQRSHDGTATPALYWPSATEGLDGEYRLDSIPIFGRLVPDSIAEAWLTTSGGSWAPVRPIRSAAGEQVASMWENGDGSVFLPFDPGDVICSYWSEGYRARTGTSLLGGAKRLAMRSYYRIRPALPRRAQIGLRRAFSRLQARASFPRWPVETALHDLYRLLFGVLGRVAGEPVPWIAPWPADYSWAIVLTHDVETSVGFEHLGLLGGIEREAGYRSSWNLVPKRYEIDDDRVRELIDAGFEVGVHGLYHDGRDLESETTLRARLPEICAAANRWEAVGFRSPATHRAWDLMPLLGFDYDSSYPDTDPFEPQSGGCCSWLPYFNRDLVELPITLPQDHTLFVILRRGESLWLEKAERIRAAGGMALLITHPDYMLDDDRLAAYRRFLAAFRDDASAWKALPREVSAWWRKRAASAIERTPEGWKVVGPASDEATIKQT
jgi:hypothetical protein